jgi:aldose 1-epimerase
MLETSLAPDIIHLDSGASRLALTLAGGCVAAYATEAGGRTLHWLRPASPDALTMRDPLLMGCFPLVPFSNRIRDGRMQAGRHAIALPANMAGCRHAIHGQGWQRPWRLAHRLGNAAEIVYDHAPDEWPFAYRAWQRFALDGPALTIEIGLRNDSPDAMPAGIGLHPFFERSLELRLTAAAAGVWLTDAEVMPLRHVAPPPPDMAIAAGARAEDLVLDNCFTGWDRRAVLAWPEWEARLEIAATAPLDFVVVYAPADRHTLCVEPVSHVVDAFNFAAAGLPATGARMLAPGETLSAAVAFTPSF